MYNIPTQASFYNTEKNSKVSIGKYITIVVTFLATIVILLILVLNIHIFKTSGSSMSPTIHEGNRVLSYKSSSYQIGDLIAYYHNDIVMIKRVIALPGDTVTMDEEGNVFVNGNELKEPYLTEKALGKPEITFPYKVPHDRYFVLGDNRADSLDSRNVGIGCIKETDVVGKVKYSIKPFKKLS